MIDNTGIDSLLDMYLFETSQLTEQLEQLILSNEGDHIKNQEAINEIFRIMHTIKGSSAMMKYEHISKLAHSLEDIFYYLREEKPKLNNSTDLSDMIFEAIDFIKAELEKIKAGEETNNNEPELIPKLKDYLSSLKQKNISQSVNRKVKHKSVQSEEEEAGCISLITSQAYKAVLYFEDGCEMENIRAFGVIHKLKEVAGEISYQPDELIDDDNSTNIIRIEGFIIYLKTDLTYDKLKEFFWQTLFLKDLELIPLDKDLGLESPTIQEVRQSPIEDRVLKDENRLQQQEVDLATKSNNQQAVTHQSFISVSVTKLDQLLDLVGEMIIAEAMVINNPDLGGLELKNFQKAAHQLDKISNEMKDMVMSIRMVPLSSTFHKMHRIVRDMCKKLNKDINLRIIGEETEVDKNIIEHISDPLMHLVRNSVDHGIETMEERVRLGKEKTGTITIEAKNAGSDVLITIKDDGQGLNKDKILRKAKDNKLLMVEEDRLSERDIYNLILLPGFSTKDNVTEFSGRGVGMDVVAKNIESISGSLSIDSIKGEGTSVTIKIPLTLAIIDAMNIRVGNSIYSIPTMFIQESFRLMENNLITDPDHNDMIMIRGQCYPVIRLHCLFHITTKITNYSDGIIIMVQQEGKSICLFADQLIGQQQIVVKSLPRYLKDISNIKGISGCTLLGDGSISLILDIAAFVNQETIGKGW